MGINAVAKYGLLFLTAFSTAVSAATSTEDDTASCVTTTAAVSTATWAIGYTAADAPTTGTGYDISADFQAAYAFNSTMVSVYPFYREAGEQSLLRIIIVG